MRNTLAALCLLALTSAPTLAAEGDTPLSAAQFEALTTGRVLAYGEPAAPWGIEEYHPGRKVRWAFVGETCEDGTWYETDPGTICFEYGEGPQCWNFFLRGGKLSAHFLNDGGKTIVPELADAPQGLSCPGPKVGV